MVTYTKGMKVVMVLHGAGVTTKENSKVVRVDKDGGVWLDNGDGNSPSGPFINGKKSGVFGFWESIEEKTQ